MNKVSLLVAAWVLSMSQSVLAKNMILMLII